MRSITNTSLKSLLLIMFCLPWNLVYALGCGHISMDHTEDAISERIKPVGTIMLASNDGSRGPATPDEPVELSADAGEKRYKTSCSLCHDQGVAGAPKFRNAADWKPRMDVGIDGLLASSIKGKGAMPPRGTCMQCSDEELKLAIEYMLPQ